MLSRQHSTQSLVLKKWESENEAIKGHQKNEYKDWITTQVAKTFNSSGCSIPSVNRYVISCVKFYAIPSEFYFENWYLISAKKNSTYQSNDL